MPTGVRATGSTRCRVRPADAARRDPAVAAAAASRRDRPAPPPHFRVGGPAPADEPAHRRLAASDPGLCVGRSSAGSAWRCSPAARPTAAARRSRSSAVVWVAGSAVGPDAGVDAGDGRVPEPAEIADDDRGRGGGPVRRRDALVARARLRPARRRWPRSTRRAARRAPAGRILRRSSVRPRPEPAALRRRRDPELGWVVVRLDLGLGEGARGGGRRPDDARRLEGRPLRSRTRSPRVGDPAARERQPHDAAQLATEERRVLALRAERRRRRRPRRRRGR